MNLENFTYLEFLEHVETTPHAKSHSEKESESKNDSGWAGTKNYKEAHDYAKYGWDAGIEKMESDEFVSVNGIPNIENNVFGSFVNIGNYLSGSPDCMVNFTDLEERNKEDLNMFVSLSYRAARSGNDAFKYCKKLINCINEKQKTHNVRLIGFFATSQKEELVTFVEIKSLDERFVMNSIAFSFHPSFFRRIFFKHLETKEYLSTWGYGRNLEKKRMIKECKNSEYYRVGDLMLPTLEHDELNWELKDSTVL